MCALMTAGLKPIFPILIGVILCVSLSTFAVDSGPATGIFLKKGIKAPSFTFDDADGVPNSLDRWQGKVLVIHYVDPDHPDINEPFTNALEKAYDDKQLLNDTYDAIGIVDCEATWTPDFLIRTIAGHQSRQHKSTVLFDYDGSLRHLWGLKRDTYNIVILDKNQVCQAIFRGKIPDSKIASVIQLVIRLQTE